MNGVNKMVYEKKLKMLKEALNLELWNITLYEDFIDRIEDQNIRKTLITLIIESIGHATAMRRAILDLKLKIPIKQKINNEKLKELLEAGIKEEKGMQKAYKKILKDYPDETIKAQAKRILNDELRHEKMVKELIKALKK